jgi:hypothetical protein
MRKEESSRRCRSGTDVSKRGDIKMAKKRDVLKLARYPHVFSPTLNAYCPSGSNFVANLVLYSSGMYVLVLSLKVLAADEIF